MKQSIVTLILSEQRGQYVGHRRQITIKINAGSKKNLIISDSLGYLKKTIPNIDVKETVSLANDIFSRKNPTGFFELTMWPSKSANPEQRSDYAIITTPAPSDPDVNYDHQYRHEYDLTNARSVPTRNMMAVGLTTIFYRYLKKDLEGFGLVQDIYKTQNVKITVPKSKLVGQDEEEKIEKPMKSDWENLFPKKDNEGFVSKKGALYITGVIKVYFVEEIKAQDLRDFLEMKGWDIGHDSNDDDDDDVEEIKEQKETKRTLSALPKRELDALQKYYFTGKIKGIITYLSKKHGITATQKDLSSLFEKRTMKEQRETPIDPVNGTGEDDDASSGETASTSKKQSPTFVAKKAVIVSNVNKLIKSIDEFSALVKDNPEEELSDLVSVFADLVNKLNDKGLVAK